MQFKDADRSIEDILYPSNNLVAGGQTALTLTILPPPIGLL